MNTKLIDHSVPLIRAVVIHPDLGERASRPAGERLEEATGLARALDLDVRGEPEGLEEVPGVGDP